MEDGHQFFNFHCREPWSRSTRKGIGTKTEGQSFDRINRRDRIGSGSREAALKIRMSVFYDPFTLPKCRRKDVNSGVSGSGATACPLASR
jgi:hypothetical protein